MAQAPGVAIFSLLAAMCFLKVLVQGDGLVCPNNIGKNSGDSDTISVFWNNTSGNGLSGVSCSPAPNSQFPIGISTVRCTAQNTTGHTVSCTFRVTVLDDHPPSAICPDSIRKTISNFQPMDSISPQVIDWEPPSTPDNAGPPQASYTHESGSVFDLGSTTVGYTIRDDAGNTGDCSFDVRVVVQPPNGHIFVKSSTITDKGFKVVWPQSLNGAVETYNLLTWKTGTPKPDPSQRLSVEPDDDARKYTYIESKVSSSDLDPAEIYNVEVSSESGVIASIEQWTKPMPPTDIKCDIKSPSSLELTWTASSGNVEQYRITSGSGIDFCVPKDTASVTLESLNPGMEHSIEVRAVVGSGKKRLESSPATEEAPLGPVNATDLIAYNYTESTISVVWEDSTSDVNPNEPFMLMINPGPPDAEKNYLPVFRTSESTASGEFKGLKPNTEYQIRLVSNNPGLYLATTQKTRPARVRELRATAVANDSITIEWAPPTDGDVNSYEVKMSPAGTQNNPTMESDTRRVFVDLKYGTEYSFRVVSVFDGMKSVPQTLMVTAGITKAVTQPLNQQAIIVGSVVGVFVLILAIVLCVTCRKYRTLKAESLAKTGRANEAVTPDNGYQVNRDRDDQEAVYELSATPTTVGEPQHYENAVMGQQRAGKAPPITKAKPIFGRR